MSSLTERSSLSTLESQEPIFNQDLNGDGMIGLATTSASSLQYNGDTLTAAYGATLLVEDRAIINAGNILIEGTLAIAVATLTLAGDGAVTVVGGTIGGSAAGEVPVNAGNTLSGFGTIGDGTSHLALENASGPSRQTARRSFSTPKSPSPLAAHWRLQPAPHCKSTTLLLAQDR
jgi:hypothetical protein